MSPIRILVADDHATYARTLQVMLSGDPAFEVIGVAGDGDEAIVGALRDHPDVVLMDVEMPGATGIEATRRIVEAAPHIAIVVLTMFDDDDVVVRSLQAGARGFVLKGARREDIVRAVRAAAAGDAVISGAVVRRLPGLVAAPVADAAGDPTAHPLLAALTDREIDVLRQLTLGKDNASIARALFLSEKTVRNYVSNVLLKLAVSSRTEAALKGRDAGL